MSPLVRWAVAGITVAVMFAGGLFLGLVLMLSGSAGDEEEYYAAAQDLCPGVAPGVVVPGQAVHPMTGLYRTTSEYGWRADPFTGARSLHGGIDFQHVQPGQPVAAVLDGVVTQSTQDTVGGYGNYVEVDHGGGLVTRYAHLRDRGVSVGQEVAAGERVGIEGTTGRSTGDHLHFEVRQDGQSTDPRVWLTEAGMSIPAVGEDPVAPGQPAQPGPVPTQKVSSPAASGGTMPPEIGGYSGEQLVNAGHIVQAGLDRGLDEWELSVAVMTAIGESSLVNIDYGDEAGPDSRGLFQQRSSWGTEEQRMHPPTAAGFFYDALVEVPGYRDLAPTIAAHRTQRNADPFHYEQHWPTAARIVAAITGDDDFLKDLPPGGGDPPGGCLPPGTAPSGPIGQCPPSGSPAETGLTEDTVYLLRCTYEAYPVPVMYGLGSRGNAFSDHPFGRAVDFALTDYRSPQGNRYGWELAHWVVGHADELNVKYVIFDMQIWTPESGWGPYTQYGDDPGDSLAHRDHVHVSVLEAGP